MGKNKPGLPVTNEVHSREEMYISLFDHWKKSPHSVLEIIGPTASGKTAFSIEVARFFEEKFNQKIEVISVDSRQIFIEGSVASAKITHEEMNGIPHHGLDLVPLEESFSVYNFQQYAYTKIREIQSRGNIAVLCGGTMLWLDAVSENYIFQESLSPSDPIPKSQQKGTPLFDFFKVGIHWDRPDLYDRINRRAIIQFENGMIEEVQELLNTVKSSSANSIFGFREIEFYLKGIVSYDEAIMRNQQRNRKYAKTQLTWWRGREDLYWVEGK